MRSIFLAFIISTVLVGCVYDSVGSSTGALGTIHDCEVAADGTFPSGDEFHGFATDVAGVETFMWSHEAPGFSLTDVSVDPDGIVCRLNGFVSATFTGTGTATVNGDPGYGFEIIVHDNRGPTIPGESISLVAQRLTRPTRWIDGEASFATPTEVTVPDTVTVTDGDPSHLWAFLWFDDLRCKYRGDGTNYVFDHCPSDGSVGPGDVLTVEYARLHIQNGRCSDGGLIEAVAVLGTTDPIEAPGPVDTYELRVTEPPGGLGPPYFYQAFDGVFDGDVAITLLP
jgi:hypothetical protein